MTGSTVARPTRGGSGVPEQVDVMLVPLDGSGFSQAAVPVAARLAARLDAEIHLFSAVRTAEEVEARDRELAGVVIPGHAVHRTVVVDADPAGAIHEALRKLDNGVACMATQGRARSAALVGSVATEVVARGRDPLILVCPYVDVARRTAGVVACVDDDPAAPALARIALGWAGLLGERCTVLTVAEDVAEDVPEPVTGGPTRRRFGPDGDVRAFLDRLVEPLRAAGHAVDATVRFDAVSVWGGLYRYLMDRPATLLVAGTRARTGVPRLVFGSVASSIVRHSESPVLVVPREDAGAER
jgi:nucleotide-binding universal stress UspA family protein